MKVDIPDLSQVTQLLAESNLIFNQNTVDRIDDFIREMVQWNTFAGLVSPNDLRHVWERHVIDSLSLAPIIVERAGPDALLLDIGSGGGFPFVPLKALLPDLGVVAIERNLRKIGFLRRAVREAGIDNGVDLLHGAFPEVLRFLEPDVITARAVEKPDRVAKFMIPYMSANTTFLCQHPEVPAPFERFHVEPWEDTWSSEGLRRGSLHLVHGAPAQTLGESLEP